MKSPYARIYILFLEYFEILNFLTVHFSLQAPFYSHEDLWISLFLLLVLVSHTTLYHAFTTLNCGVAMCVKLQSPKDV